MNALAWVIPWADWHVKLQLHRTGVAIAILFEQRNLGAPILQQLGNLLLSMLQSTQTGTMLKVCISDPEYPKFSKLLFIYPKFLCLKEVLWSHGSMRCPIGRLQSNYCRPLRFEQMLSNRAPMSHCHFNPLNSCYELGLLWFCTMSSVGSLYSKNDISEMLPSIGLL